MDSTRSSEPEIQLFTTKLGELELPSVWLGAPCDLVLTPNPILRETAYEVAPEELVTEEFRELVCRMILTMYLQSGVGLAANQVGDPRAFFVYDCQWGLTQRERPGFLANPLITAHSGEQLLREGCLSVGSDAHAPVRRAEKVTVTGLDIEGKQVTIEAEGLQAVCFQHEIDHLNGLLFTDRLSKLHRDMVERRRRKLKKRGRRLGKSLRKVN